MKKHEGELASFIINNRTMVESLSDGYLLVGPKGKIRNVNSAYCIMTGYSKSELLQKTIFDVRPDMDVEDQKKLVRSFIKEKTKNIKSRHLTKSGESLELFATLVAIEKDNGTYIAGIVKNLSEREKVFKELKLQSVFNNKLLEATNDGYILADSKGIIRDVNPAYCRMVGYTKEELLQMTIEELEANLTREEIFDVIQTVMQAGNAKFETRHKNRFGEDVILESNLTLIEGIEKDPLVVGFVRDITAKKKALKKHKESEERWESLVKNNPQPVVLSQNSRIIYINQAGLEMYGTTDKQELLGRSVYDLVHQDDEKQVRNRISKLEDGRDVKPAEVKWIQKNGDIRFLEVHSTPTTYRGEIVIQTVLHDITNRTLYQNKIEESLKQKETLLKEIHHRVKNNMAVVSGLMELQIMDAKNEEFVEQLRENQQRIQAMAGIHEKLYQNELLTSISCSDQLQDLVESLLRSYDAETVKVHYELGSIILNINQAIPCALIMNEVVTNCLKHAFESYENAEIWIHTKNKEGKALIEVIDNGVGIPDSMDIYSTGSLGMTLINLLAIQLHGEIKIQKNTEGSGTKSRLSFRIDE